MKSGASIGVEDRPAHRRDHGRSRPVLRAQAVRDRHRDDLEDEAYRDDADVGPGERHDGLGRPEDPEDRVHEDPAYGHDGDRGRDGREEGLPEDGRRLVALLRAHRYRYQRRGPHAEEGAQALRHEHHREARGHRGEGVGAHALADEDAVDEIVEAVDEHDGDGGEREFQEEGAERGFSHFRNMVH